MDILALSDLYVEPAVQLYIQLQSNPNMTVAQKNSLLDVYGKKFIDAENAFESNKKSMVQNKEYMRRLYRLFIALFSILGYVIIIIVGYTTIKNIMDTNKRINTTESFSSGQDIGAKYTTKRTLEAEKNYLQNKTEKTKTELNPEKIKLDDSKFNSLENADLKETFNAISKKHSDIITALNKDANANLDKLIRDNNTEIVQKTLQILNDLEKEINTSKNFQDKKTDILKNETDIKDTFKLPNINKVSKVSSFLGRRSGILSGGTLEQKAVSDPTAGDRELTATEGAATEGAAPGAVTGAAGDPEPAAEDPAPAPAGDSEPGAAGAVTGAAGGAAPAAPGDPEPAAEDPAPVGDSEPGAAGAVTGAAEGAAPAAPGYPEPAAVAPAAVAPPAVAPAAGAPAVAPAAGAPAVAPAAGAPAAPEAAGTRSIQPDSPLKLNIPQTGETDEISFVEKSDAQLKLLHEYIKGKKQFDIHLHKYQQWLMKFLYSLKHNIDITQYRQKLDEYERETKGFLTVDQCIQKIKDIGYLLMRLKIYYPKTSKEITPTQTGNRVNYSTDGTDEFKISVDKTMQWYLDKASEEDVSSSLNSTESQVKKFSEGIKTLIDYDAQSNRILRTYQQNQQKLATLTKGLENAPLTSGGGPPNVAPPNVTRMAARVLENYSNVKTLLHCCAFLIYMTIFIAFIGMLITDHENYQNDIHDLMVPPYIPGIMQPGTTRVLYQTVPKKSYLMRYVISTKGPNGTKKATIDTTVFMAETLDTIQYTSPMRRDLKLNQSVQAILGFVSRDDNLQNDESYLSDSEMAKVVSDELAPLFLQQYIYLHRPNLTLLDKTTTEQFAVSNNTDCIERCLYDNSCKAVAFSNNICFKNPTIQTVSMADPANGFTLLVKPGLCNLSIETASNAPATIPSTLSNYMDYFTKEDTPTNLVRTLDLSSGIYMTPESRIYQLTHFKQTLLNQIQSLQDRFFLKKELDYSILFDTLRRQPEFKQDHVMAAIEDIIKEVNIQNQLLREADPLSGIRKKYITFEEFKVKVKGSTYKSAYETLLEPLYYIQLLTSETMVSDTSSPAYIFYKRGIDFKKNVVKNLYNSMVALTVFICIHISLQGFFKGFVGNPMSLSKKYNPETNDYSGPEYKDKKNDKRDFFIGLIADYSFVLLLFISVAMFLNTLVYNWQNKIENLQTYNERTIKHNQNILRSLSKDIFENAVHLQHSPFVSFATTPTTSGINFTITTTDGRTFTNRNTNTTAPDCKNIVQLRDRCLSQTPRQTLTVNNTHHIKLKEMHSRLIEMLHSYEQCNISTLGSINKAPFPIGDILTYLVIILVCIVMIVLLTKIMQPSKVFTEIKVLMRNEETQNMKNKSIVEAGGEVPCKGDFDFSDEFLDSIVKIIVALIVVVFVSYIIFVITASADRTRSALYVSHQAKESRCTDQ